MKCEFAGGGELGIGAAFGLQRSCCVNFHGGLAVWGVDVGFAVRGGEVRRGLPWL
jgi:hypothetical protein